MPNVKPEILRWARQNSSLSEDEATRKLSIKDSKKQTAQEKLVAYESGELEPSRSLLLRMSKQYHVPLLTFYLHKPPLVGYRGEDFRTLPNGYEETDNVYVDVLIRDIKARQSTVRDTLLDEDEENEIEIIDKCKISDGYESVAMYLREKLDFDFETYRSQTNYKAAFKYLRQSVESLGIFVLLKGNLGSYHTNIPTTVFRGFVLSDDIAPFIVINDQDSESAWSFTLLHELAHLVLGQTGISGAYFDNTTERFCNDVASEFFLPNSEFKEFKIIEKNYNELKIAISDYAFTKKLSNTHIAYRLYKRGDIEKKTWNSLRKFYFQKWKDKQDSLKEKNRAKDGGPNYYLLQKYKLGKLVSLVERLTFAGALTTTKAGMLLDIKPLKVYKFFHSEQPI